MKTIGIYGAVGTYDFGDNAMMIKNIENIYNKNSDTKFVIFTPDIKVTRYHCEMYIKDISLLNRIKIVDDGIHFMNPIEIEEHGIKVPVFDSEDLNIQRFNNIKDLWESSFNGDISHLDYDLRNSIKELDVLVFNGGGYIYDGWGDRVVYFMTYVNIAHAMGIPVVFLGNSFGPLCKEYKYYVSKSLSLCKSIKVRDGLNYSYRFLTEENLDNIVVGADDLIFECAPIPSACRKNHVIIEIMGAVEENKAFCEKFISGLKTFITYALSEEKTVYLVNFGKKDRIAKRIIEKIKYSFIDNEKVIPIFEMIDVEKTFELYQNACFSISVRYHPLVLSLGNETQCVSVLTGESEYYYMKMHGCFDSLGITEENNIIDLNSFSSAYLIDRYKNKRIDFSNIQLKKIKEIHDKYLNLIVEEPDADKSRFA